MSVYSYSKINTYFQCPLRFKFLYIDKLEKDFKNSIESFMGTITHDSLEYLYKELKLGKEVNEKQLIDFFKKRWKSKMNKDVMVIRKNSKKRDYFNKGIKFLKDYFIHYYPFDQDYTVGLETSVNLDLFNDRKYVLRGYIDRLGIKDTALIIHDYKTANSLPTKEDIKKNDQLALYAIGLIDKYVGVESVKLIWHFLAFDKEIEVELKREDLEVVRKRIASKIDKIEEAREFNPKESALCDWCEFASNCPMKEHVIKTKQMSLEEFSNDYGVKMVSEYFDLEAKKDAVSSKLELLKDKIFEFGRREKLSNLSGEDGILRLYDVKKPSLPSKNSPKYIKIKGILRDKNLYEYLSIDYALNTALSNSLLSEDLNNAILSLMDEKEIKKIYPKKSIKND
jgi:putative RecB family exonuclease